MRNRWDEKEAARFAATWRSASTARACSAAIPTLVLHGGGNTSVKLREPNVFGDEEDMLYVKGSGWDLATIEAAGFAPVRLRPLQRLAELDALCDVQMAKSCASTRSTPPRRRPRWRRSSMRSCRTSSSITRTPTR